MKIGKWMGAVLGWLFLTLAISIALAMMVYIKSEKEAQKPGGRFWEIAGPGLLMGGVRQGMSAPLREGVNIEERSLSGGVRVTSMAFPASTTDIEGAAANVIRRSRPMGAEEREQFSRPPASYETGDGLVYELADWRVECIPGGVARHDMEKEMTYRSVEAAQTVPAVSYTHLTETEQMVDREQQTPVAASYDPKTGYYTIHVENEVDWEHINMPEHTRYRAVTSRSAIEHEGDIVYYNRYLVEVAGAGVSVNATVSAFDAGSYICLLYTSVVGANRSGARIGGTGNFQGIRAGDYTVRCSLASNPEVQDTAVVHVSVLPEYLYLEGPSGVAPGTAIQLEAMVFPEDAAYDGIDWEIETGKEHATVSKLSLIHILWRKM